jgi:hypothetical protein
LPRSMPTERICMSMILLEPANKITHCNVEIKRRTISLTGVWEISASNLPQTRLYGHFISRRRKYFSAEGLQKSTAAH